MVIYSGEWMQFIFQLSAVDLFHLKWTFFFLVFDGDKRKQIVAEKHMYINIYISVMVKFNELTALRIWPETFKLAGR